MPIPDLKITRANAEDLPRLQAIRASAFEPVYASFRAMLGEELYSLVQARDDEAQAGLLASMLRPDSVWELYSVREGEHLVGFVSVRLDSDAKVGEIGLNAVHPDNAGQGIGTAMYEFALARMREAGMRAATVSTGGDPSHAPARRAYEKAGFNALIPSVWMCRKL